MGTLYVNKRGEGRGERGEGRRQRAENREQITELMDADERAEMRSNTIRGGGAHLDTAMVEVLAAPMNHWFGAAVDAT